MRFLVAAIGLIVTVVSAARAEDKWFGASKVDATPQRPVRLSGYSNRDRPFEGVDEPLFVRTLVMKVGEAEWAAWTVVEALGVSPAMRDEVLRQVAPLGIIPARFAFCATHTHTAPHLRGVAPNIFAPRMEGAEADRTGAYTDELVGHVVESIKQAIAAARPGTLELGWGSATFAANRRVLKDGKCVAMAPFPEGPTDPKVPVLRVRDRQGRAVAVLFNYACHATTLDGNHNRVSGDWPGLAAAGIEQEIAGVVAIPMIGCGADTNPEPRGQKEMAFRHGAAMKEAVLAVLRQPMRAIEGEFSAVCGLVGLAIDRPNQVELAARLLSTNLHIKQNAQDMLAILDRKDRIPETYPAPIQVMRFGNDLTMVFLGGEVVGDYVFRIRKEFKETIPEDHLWVTAYANDVYGYLASERMIDEGGYEYDYSMLFYDQPGPWSRGTEDAVLARVHDLIERPLGEGNLSPRDSLSAIRVAEGLEVEQVAAEPLVMDPVNIAFGADGKLWVAEMGDYPWGPEGVGSPGGRVRYLEDTDGDGKFDKSTLFLDQLRYTTGVLPYRNGVIVSSTPEVFYVEVDQATGKAGKRVTLLDGFGDGNPQHVVNGFAVGLDNWIYLNGDETGDIRSLKTGKVVPMSGRDGRFKPDAGELETECGMTQHLRSRDDFGEWFGGANYCPFWHYLLEERYLARNPHVATPRPWEDLYGGYYPPVFPTSRITGKFNDLFTANRFTSACSPSPYRDRLLGNGSSETILCCEPVHNLVHRAKMVRDGISLKAARFPSDEASEFFSSRDPWCRPVRVTTGPDGAVWIVDMYRQVIEHPTWIPEAWLDRLDVRAGHEKGRIYRVFPEGKRPAGNGIPRLAELSVTELVKELDHPNGWRRDTAQRLLIQRADVAVRTDLEEMVGQPSPIGAVHALGTLRGMGVLNASTVRVALKHPAAEVRRWGLRHAEEIIADDPSLIADVETLESDPDERVQYQTLLCLGNVPSDRAARAIGALARRHADNLWFRTAALSSAAHAPDKILERVLAEGDDVEGRSSLVDGLLATVIGKFGDAGLDRALLAILPPQDQPIEDWHRSALDTLLEAIKRKGTSFTHWAESEDKRETDAFGRLARVYRAAREDAVDEKVDAKRRAASILLLGRGFDQNEEDQTVLASLLSPHQPTEVQSAVVESLEKVQRPDVPGRLLSSWKSIGPAVRAEMVSALIGRPEWAEQLLEAVEKGEVLPTEIETTAVSQLVEHNRRTIAERAQQIFRSDRSTRADVLERYASVATMTGDATQGRSVFVKSCAACHRFGGLGQLVGPDLGGVRDRSPGYLLSAVLDPNRAVEAKYVSYSVELTDGRVLSGLLVVESSNSITLARPDGSKVEILRSDIESMLSSGKSFMPEGLEKDLSPQQLADLFAFLAQPPEAVHP